MTNTALIKNKKGGIDILEDELMTRRDVAEFLHVSLSTADSFIHNKDFDGLLYIGRSVRISKNRLLQYIQNHLQYKI